jgi:cytoskeletal protein CcmA (bactofilin family)
MALFSSKDAPPPTSRPAPRTDVPQQSGGTYIGPNITVEGTISGSEAIRIEGSVKGRIQLSSDLLIGTKGRVEATVHARNVVIEGRLTGDVSADDKVELVASAAVDGNIKAPKVIVAEGAKFRGSVDMGSSKPREADLAAAVKK